MKIHIKRIYEESGSGDGARILVDRLWPRGISKEAAEIVSWARDIAPSNELRRWYNHEHSSWTGFKKRYFAELDANPEGVALLQKNLDKKVTFLFSSRERKLNNAAALKEYVEARLLT
jgi:uncharacterized protein YeaO (DUF488 family)